MALVTVAQVKSYLPHVDASSTSEDTLLTTLIERAEAAIARHCRYPAPSATTRPTMESTSYTLYVRARVPQSSRGWADEEKVYRTLRLPVRPVTAVASIYADPDQGFGSAYLVASTDYDYSTDGESGEIHLKPTAVLGSWYPQPRSQKVSCTAGWTSANVPADLAHAICLLVASYHKRRAYTGVERQSTADGASVEFEKGFPAEVKELLATFVLAVNAWVGQ